VKLARKNYNQKVPEAGDTPPARQLSDVSESVEGGATHASPARALQHRLARELVAPRRQWIWHTIGLVLAVMLSLFAAGTMLDSGL
jgi:hypothetical protein